MHKDSHHRSQHAQVKLDKRDDTGLNRGYMRIQRLWVRTLPIYKLNKIKAIAILLAIFRFDRITIGSIAAYYIPSFSEVYHHHTRMDIK